MFELRRQGPVSRVPSRLGLAALITANLFIALHALNSGWGYHQALLIFWFEALIIGGYNVLRLLVVGLFGDQPFGAWLSRTMSVSLGSRILGTLIGTAFFVVKFGAFALSTGFWIVAMPAYFDAPGSRPADRVTEALGEVGSGLGIAVGVLVASHGVSFLWNFLCNADCCRAGLLALRPHGACACRGYRWHVLRKPKPWSRSCADDGRLVFPGQDHCGRGHARLGTSDVREKRRRPGVRGSTGRRCLRALR
jgi:hypothetical protein